ncbi:EF-P 5-aminopentanol modification-associated protein YfmH [Streptococcus zalophi]|uniref:EF-P 5-aminopentanol modification-associated protein YfmH n=1 Tax=Streptococcus zalophi TaxID=640031 RepID=UPI00215CCE4E|nr:pitrilysin family protein [Streptococcus zalophi]MCR8968144.1 insulinase family protein [Streptococcus zalophi]
MSDLKKIAYSSIDEEIFFSELSSGLRLYLIPKKDFQEVYAMMTCHFGSIDNHFTVNDKKKDFPLGIAHFLEHQLFDNGSQEDIAQQFSKLGSESNAFTGFEKTHYYFSGSNNLLASLDLLLTLVSKHTFTDESIKKEKEIIKKEIALYQDDPDNRLYEGVLKNMYPKTALAEDIVGTNHSIEKITVKHLQDCFSFFYQPSHLELVVIGDFDINEVYSSISTAQKKWAIDKKQTIDRLPLSLQPVVKKSSIMMPISISKLAIGIRRTVSDKIFSMKEKIKIDLFFSLLFGWTSKDYQTWYDKGMIDDSFSIETTLSNRYQFVVISLDTNHPIAMSSHIKKKIKMVSSKTDFTSQQLDRLKKERYGEFIRSLDALDVLTQQLIEADDSFYFDYPDILMSIGLNEVIEAGQEFLNHSELTEFMIFPK